MRAGTTKRDYCMNVSGRSAVLGRCVLNYCNDTTETCLKIVTSWCLHTQALVCYGMSYISPEDDQFGLLRIVASFDNSNSPKRTRKMSDADGMYQALNMETNLIINRATI